ncbi:leucine/isoleucine/valine transporter permease subunit [Thalassovita gelatinovora]|uniref:Leucine/isoleucine/valine transporter permease subunit n=1 Tax=Thalassovita gelatinovora TaxID=53501 RepID=A0A0P1FHQ6_THAGE|nr:urea ABC transporter permease subunit UrtC [Thalassovita gelatinovora]QIZ82009.1 urea ABC transporter permease subunit UrtC [Thalassovita gelatinovora]CUH67468.1 leucine/isoleucine/valine transporter permease subunit [Thalassovita gelatinovora]SEP73430.1 amino acid/amide ABC transporter membrane protein 2, HAAT family [Thalassovita gelatinovora]
MLSKFQYDLVALVIFALVVAFGVPAVMNYDGFELNTFARYLALAIVSMALALSWGTAGLLNLGQAATFGMGSYAMAMHLKLRASDGLPDFMGWNNVETLPWMWVPFESLAFTLLAGLLVPAFIGGLIAIFMFRARVAGVFVAIITLAFLVAFQLLFINQQGLTGGQNGLTGLAQMSLFGWSVDTYSMGFYYLVAGCLVVAMAIGVYLTHCKFGLILRAIREDADRARFFGYNVASYQTLIFCISAALAGWAGMLYTMVLEFASPTYMGVSFSLAIVIWCAVGGRESVIAAAFGAIVVNMLEGRLSDVFVEGWHLILGVIFVLVVMFMPRGIYGLLSDGVQKLRGPGRSQDQRDGETLPNL